MKLKKEKKKKRNSVLNIKNCLTNFKGSFYLIFFGNAKTHSILK